VVKATSYRVLKPGAKIKAIIKRELKQILSNCNRCGNGRSV
jgi:hypothetical protein